jgi:hypothetical protein
MLNPLVPEAARLLAGSYDLFDGWDETPTNGGGAVDLTNRRWPPWCGPPDPWEYSALGWRNVQLMVAWRDLREDLGEVSEGDLFPGAPRPRLVVGVVPGTNELSDWPAGNLNFLPVRVGGLPGRWRSGFALAGEWVWSEVERRSRPGDRLALAGHSYGGAVATVAAAHAMRDGASPSVAGVLSFAAPRVCSGRAAAVLDARFGMGIGQRIVMGFDVVPWMVPPLWWRHAFEPVFVSGSGEVSNRYHVLREAARALCTRGLQSVGDHSMSRYLRWASSLPAATPLAGKKTGGGPV